MLRSFFKNREGSVFAIVGLGILVLVGSVGVAVDVGRGQMAQAKLQSAVDAAGLAAGASVNSADLQAEVEKYVNVNFSQGTLGATVTDVDYVLSDDKDLLTVDVTAVMPTSFMSIFGHETMDLKAHTEVTRSNKGMELAIVLDVTGSMDGTKIDSLKTASNDLLTILFGADATAENLWVGIVPFAQGVNVGNSHDDWISTAQAHNSLDWGGNNAGTTYEWAGCVEARYTGNDVTVATPATEKLLAYYWAEDDSNNDWIIDKWDTLCGPTSSNSCRCTTQSGGTHNCNCVLSGTTETCIECSGSGSNKKCIQQVSTITTLCGPTSSNSCRCTTSTGGTYVCGTTHSTGYKHVTSCSGSSGNKKCTKKDSPVSYDIVDTGTWNSHKGPSRWCPTPVTPLTNVKATLTDAIAALKVGGQTHIPVGAVWGWRLVDPDWKTFWGGTMQTNNLPLAYNTDLMIKAVVIMTDGKNTMFSNWDGAYGYLDQEHLGTDDATDAAAELDTRLTTVCNAMKTKGIYVYTVLFQETDAGIKTKLQNCATVPDYFFDTTTGADLQTAFKKIGDSLANLRISK